MSVLLAGLIIPEAYHTTLEFVKYLIPPIEIFVFGYIIYKTRTIVKDHQALRSAEVDFTETLRSILLKHLKYPAIANILCTETSIFYYAFFGWQGKNKFKNETVFSYHIKSAYFTIIAVFIFLILAETLTLHLVLYKWSHIVAWIFTGLSIYGLIFLLGDSVAVKKRPISIDNEFLYLRIGIRWYSKIRIADIESIELTRQLPLKDDHADFVLFGSPNISINLRCLQSAVGYYGITKKFRSFSLLIDDASGFINFLDSRIEAN